MNSKVKVSVIMSVYNESPTMLMESIDSIRNQSISDFEFIIVDDNPQCKKIKTILNYYSDNDSRIKVIKNEKNIGLVKSLNKALKEAKGKYIARMDADDISEINRLEKECNYLLRTNSDIVSSFAKKIDVDGNEIDVWRPKKVEVDNVSKLLQTHNFIIHPTVLFKNDRWINYRSIDSAEDYDLWLRFLTRGKKITILPEYLLKYRIREESITQSNHLLMDLSSKYVLNLYEERKKRNSYKDKFSLNDFYVFLEKRGCFNDRYRTKYNNSFNKYSIVVSKVKNNNLFYIIELFFFFIANPLFLVKLISNLKNRVTRYLVCKSSEDIIK